MEDTFTINGDITNNITQHMITGTHKILHNPGTKICSVIHL